MLPGLAATMEKGRMDFVMPTHLLDRAARARNLQMRTIPSVPLLI